jgi:hypothetical protein
LNTLKHEVTLLKESLGDGKPTGAVYADIVYEARVQGPECTDALWFKLIGVALERCEVNVGLSKTYTLLLGPPTEATEWEKDTLLGRAVDIKRILDRALSEVNKYDPPEYQQDVEFRKRFPDRIEHSHWQADERDKIRKRRLTMKWGLIQDINRCLTLATVYKAYCVRLQPYLGETPTAEWKACELSGHLKMYGILAGDAAEICAALGAIRPEHLAYVEAGDLVGPSIPAAARPALITAVQDYRKKNGITKDIDARPAVGNKERTVTTAHAHLVQMRALVEAF